MRLIPHAWNTHDSHSHTSPLTKSPPHQNVQNCYWNYLMTDQKIWCFWCPSQGSHHHHQRSPWMSLGIDSARIGASTDEKIADKVWGWTCWDHHPLNSYLILRNPSYFLELYHYIIPSHSKWSYYLRFPISCTQHNMGPFLKKSTLWHISVRVIVTDIVHNRCCADQRNGHRKFWSRRRRKMKFMARMIIISFKKKLQSLFLKRTWYWKDWTSWILCLRKLSSRAGSTNSWMNDIGLKIRVVSQWTKSLKRMWQDNFRSIRNGRQHSWFGSCRDKEN